MQSTHRVEVVRVEKVEKHPNADKLTVCTVNAGRERLQVVCGAPNARAGLKAPLALAGTELRSLAGEAALGRGVESRGMLLAASDDGGLALVQPGRAIAPGARVK